MKTSTVLVLAVLALLVFMYIRKVGIAAESPFTNPNTSPTNAQSGTQQVATSDVFNRVMQSVDMVFNRVADAIQTSPNSV